MTAFDLWRAFADFWGAERYSQHSICLTSDPVLIILYTASDLTIFFSYFSIGISLYSNRIVLAELNPVAILLYAVFIFLCGCTHFMDVVLLWTGMYRLDVLIRGVTAAVSAVTATYTVAALWGEQNAPT